MLCLIVQIYDIHDRLFELGIGQFEPCHATNQGVTKGMVNVQLTRRSRGQKGVVQVCESKVSFTSSVQRPEDKP